jgi:hypothetical protein
MNSLTGESQRDRLMSVKRIENVDPAVSCRSVRLARKMCSGISMKTAE